MLRLRSCALLVAWAFGAAARPAASSCPPYTHDTLEVHQYQLYPENAAWDSNNCVLSLFNATVVKYDPYARKVQDIISFPGVSDHRSIQVTGVNIDPHTGLLSVVAGAGSAFPSAGADLSGPTYVVKYDPSSRKMLWKVDLAAATNGTVGGFQDLAVDARGNTYVVGTYPGTIWRIDKDGRKATQWWPPPPEDAPTDTNVSPPRAGFEGVAVAGDTLLVNDGKDGQLYRFDMRKEKGDLWQVPTSPRTTIADGDALCLPAKYGGRVLLAAMEATGVSVFWSRDAAWKTAEYLGTVAVAETATHGASVPAAVQVGGDRLFVLEAFYGDPAVSGTRAGKRAVFPTVEITQKVSALVGW